MSTIYFFICVLCFTSTISAIPAPAVVYSAVIYNTQNTSIQCNIGWLHPSGKTVQDNRFTVEKNNYYLINQKNVDLEEGWTAREIIQEIHCGELVLKSPFKKVHSPTSNWEFRVGSERIVSVGPSSYVPEGN
jgi:hypothetical protein